VFTVRVTVTADPFGVKLVGENKQLAPDGKLLQPIFTCWLKPFNGDTVTV
jgi:hypothetical protein